MDIETHNELETKAGIPLDSVVTHGEMMRAFEAFKETNDQRLALTEKRGGDVVVEEKLARINTAIDDQILAVGVVERDRQRVSRNAGVLYAARCLIIENGGANAQSCCVACFRNKSRGLRCDQYADGRLELREGR